MNKRQRWALVFVCASVPDAAFAFSLMAALKGTGFVAWKTSPVTYELNQEGSGDIGDGSDLTAVRQGIASWNNVTCATVVLSESGTTPSTDTLVTTNTTDGVNRLTWVEDNRWAYGKYVLGVTPTVFYDTGEILEADIAFNGYSNTWSLDGKTNTIDIESVAVHELGHFIGVQHVLGGEQAEPPPTMAPTLLPSLQSRSLSRDDELAVCFLYPTGAYGCADDCDCPGLLESTGDTEYMAGAWLCQQHACQKDSATNKPLGARCNSTDCQAGLFCQPTEYGSYCSKDCATDPECGTGFTCWPFTNSSGGACMPKDLANTKACVADSAMVAGDSSNICACNQQIGCDADGSGAPCSCDPDCSLNCDCDVTTACDATGTGAACVCDPQCKGGCSSLSSANLSFAGLLLVFSGLMWLVRGR